MSIAHTGYDAVKYMEKNEEFCLAEGITLLNLTRLNLTQLPWWFFINVRHLRDLDLSSNKLTSVPKDVGKLIQLERLDLSSNKLTSVPKEIGNLTQMKRLDLSKNQLTSLPIDIGYLTELKYLNLSGNQFTSIPKEIGNFKLKKLYLSDNQLREIPKDIIWPWELKWLNLNNNYLTIFPKNMFGEFHRLRKLRHLLLSDNLLSTVPSKYWSGVKELWLSGNHLTSIEPSMMDKLFQKEKVLIQIQENKKWKENKKRMIEELLITVKRID